MLFCELRQMEVVNVCNGCRLGYVCDFELDCNCGRILAIIVPAPSRFFGLVKGEADIIIPWEKICKIGKDVILVEIHSNYFKKI